MALSMAKLADLRKRMTGHKTKKGRAVVELTAKELQDLLDAVDRTVAFKNREIDAPDGDSPDHLFEVKLAVLAPSGSSPDSVLTHVMASVLRHPTQPLPVVNGYGAAVKNITLGRPGARGKFRGGMYCTGFTNKSVAKLPKVPIIERDA